MELAYIATTPIRSFIRGDLRNPGYTLAPWTRNVGNTLRKVWTGDIGMFKN